MNKLLNYPFALVLCSLSGVLLAQAQQFADYPLQASALSKPATTVRFNKFPELRRYKTALLNSLKDGPNFALNYTVVEIGCGTACQLIAVIDSQGEIVHKAQTCVGAAYRLDSRLLVLNPPAENPTAFGCETSYWVLPQ